MLEYFVLLEAIDSGNLQKVSAILTSGTSVEPPPGDQSALIRACDNCDSEMVQLLIEAGADVDYFDDVGDSALICAAVVGSVEITRLLVTAGADPNAVGRSGSALSYARHHRHNEVIKVLESAVVRSEYGI